MINSKIKHVVVVMFENRSFDHMLGFLYNDSYKNKKADPSKINISPLGHPYEGLTGNETNPDGKNGSVKVFPIDKNDKYAYYMPKMDPGEGFMNTNYQLFGASIPPFDGKIGSNQGFVLDFEGKIGNKYYGDPPKKKTTKNTTPADSYIKKSYPKDYDHSKDYGNDDYQKWYKEELPPNTGLKIVPKFPGTVPADIMGMHTPDTLPILSNLAKGYAVCDHYYCSVPSETLPNRAFMHMATSQGHLYDEIKRYSAPSIFKNLTDHGRTWGIFGYKAKKEPYTFTFCEDISSDTLVTDKNSKPTYILPKGCQSGKYTEFQAALKNKTLPDYTFLEPSWGSYGNSQHPNYDVAKGEEYMLDIYNSLRASDYWENTLLIINYDEHGGCYDHVTPPTGATQPNAAAVNANNGFTFDRFGVRVPCVLISPWIEAGTVYRAQNVPFDHTSILKTLEVLFNLPPLTARDAAAEDMLSVLTLETARTDNPLENIKPPVADPSVTVENHASQILRAQADAVTEKRNSQTGSQDKTPEFKTDEEAHAYIDHSY